MVAKNENLSFDATVGQVLRSLFPHGTNGLGIDRVDLPAGPATVFGAAAYLLERSGAYHHILPPIDGAAAAGNRVLAVRVEDRAFCEELGREWLAAILDAQTKTTHDVRSKVIGVRAKIDEFWKELYQHVDAPLHIEPDQPLPDWCLPAYKLLVIADEAARDFGYGRADGQIDPFEALVRDDYSMFYRDETAWHLSASAPTSFAPMLNPKLARVLPKSRTPAVGCTTRTLSHNLALVPPQGIVNFTWYRERVPFPGDREPLNLLLVPFPYRISGRSFRSAGVARHADPKKNGWGWFDVEQTWLRPAGLGATADDNSAAEAFAAFVLALIAETEKDVGRVHGVVFPELALDARTHRAIMRALKESQDSPSDEAGRAPRPPIDFLVCGVSENPVADQDLRGNFVAVTTFSLGDQRELRAATYSRAKHHRWQLNSAQITSYGLAASLDPNVTWWEANAVDTREIGLTVFRAGAIFATMICEDLARSEPCHEPLRAVGPNLVFVLLMDGPQLQHRWPARYATTLADDPGSSVLTLTSLGLIERANASGRYPPSRDVAIWKDDSGQTVQISCPRDAQAVVISLSGTTAEEFTLDGRSNDDTQAWRYRGHQNIKVATDPSAPWSPFLR